ncbi:MAG: formimidoylglutamate deiminase [Cohaesibacteraceae bacterium]|nr:formimidoylglutamate deiminase [Cohaesibacteraceae bacterium]
MLFVKNALLPKGWAENVRIEIDASGHISSVEPNTSAEPEDDLLIDRALLPAPHNLHSHSFQRAMAGMTETRFKKRDSFWSWRDLMYRFLDRLTPDDIEAIAALVFMEMQEAGYAAVGEFHYLHNQPGGAEYVDIGELSERICASASQTGIGLTLLPVLYNTGGSDGRPLKGGQLRFRNSIDRFEILTNRCRDYISNLPDDAVLGIAPHSLRAVPASQINACVEIMPDGPIHCHVAEQIPEIEEIRKDYGSRPMRWILDNAPIDDRWCLIHCTHMDEIETRDLAQSGAVTGLCPITESNLGDGIFNGPEFMEHGGLIGIGSDSNIRISLSEELRTLEYSQRLRHNARNLMLPGEGSVGQFLFESVCKGSSRALGRKAGEIAEGNLADMLTLDLNNLSIAGLQKNQWLDGLIFAGDDGAITDVWSAGRKMVENGTHVHRNEIETRYRATMKKLLEIV